jgi:hypothetical protein
MVPRLGEEPGGDLDQAVAGIGPLAGFGTWISHESKYVLASGLGQAGIRNSLFRKCEAANERESTNTTRILSRE